MAKSLDCEMRLERNVDRKTTNYLFSDAQRGPVPGASLHHGDPAQVAGREHHGGRHQRGAPGHLLLPLRAHQHPQDERHEDAGGQGRRQRSLWEEVKGLGG